MASMVGREGPEEKESHGVTPSEVQGSRFKTSTEEQDSRTGVTLHGEEGVRRGARNGRRRGPWGNCGEDVGEGFGHPSCLDAGVPLKGGEGLSVRKS